MSEEMKKEVLDKAHQLLMRFTTPTLDLKTGVIRHSWSNGDASMLFHQYMKILPNCEILQSFPITIEFMREFPDHNNVMQQHGEPT